jgi:ATP-dependent helicase/nuclease subunit B
VLKQLKNLTPAAAFYVQLLRQLENVKHPSEATATDDPTFDLKIKPRGVIDWAHRHLFDVDHEEKMSQVVNLEVTNRGAIGYKNRSDGCESDEFNALLKHVQKTLALLGDQIIGGQINVTPYRIGQSSPCPTCEFRSVCRFDAAINSYRPLEPMKREQVLAKVCQECG